MLTRKKSLYLKAAALLVIVSTVVFAAFTFNPATQPLVTLATYGLKNYDLSTPDNRAYRPWLENGAYQGDVIEYNLDTAGVRTSTAESLIGVSPVSDLEKTELWQYGQNSLSNTDTAPADRPNWMARATFYAQECADDTCTSYTDYWKNGRNIYTYNGTGKVAFTWGNLSTAQQQALDPVAYKNKATQSTVLNYVRGDHTLEKSQPNGTLRSRFSLLGDIVDSTPVYIGPPAENYDDTGFQTFKTTYATRPGLVGVGANDGMLHLLSEKDGSESYAYIPSMLIPALPKLAVPPPYVHTYYVDGRITVASAKVDDGSGMGTTKWATVLVTGLGAGGPGLVALDVTDPNPLNFRVLFEKSSSTFGYIYGKSTLYRMAGGDWYAITGNGYGAGRARLLLINLRTNAVTSIYTLSTDTKAGLSEPTLVDSNNDLVGDYVYAGDTNGNMWKFDFTGLDPTSPDFTKVAVTKIYDPTLHGVTLGTQPITTGPEVGESPYGGYMVYFGTGNATSMTDASNLNYPAQAVYGIWDRATGSTIVEQKLTQTTYTFNTTTNQPEIVRYVSTDPFRADPSKTYAYICVAGVASCTAIQGWKVTLGLNERLIEAAPQLRAGRVTFVANNPTGTNTDASGNLTTDLEGDAWLMSLDYLTGGDGVGTDRQGPYYGVAFNLNGDDLLDQNDAIHFNDGSYKAPVGLDLGQGTISQPAIARLGPAIDIMYINGLKLPWPQVELGGPFYNGHIDVVTDSPAGGSKAPNAFSYMSEGYNTVLNNTPVNDGVGRAVDGLVHAYSDIHGVTYVDLFQLEPRRGMTSMDGTPFPPQQDAYGNKSCLFNPGWTVGTDVLEIHQCGTNETPPKCTGALVSCVVTNLDAELNRAYDMLTTKQPPGYGPTLADGTCPTSQYPYGPFYTLVRINNVNECKETYLTQESEVNLLGGGTIPSNKPFFLTLANADLSTGGTLQIGCRTWNVQDYQDMVTAQLESGTKPAELVDTYHTGFNAGSLVFTFDDIVSGNKDIDANGKSFACPKESPQPTLRISFQQRSILDLGIIGTRSQCVLGLHKPEDKVCYADSAVLSAAEDIVPGIDNKTYTPVSYTDCGSVTDPWTVPDPPVGNNTYLQSPAGNWHITWNPNYPGFPQLTGFRWRNGALTAQLLDPDHYTLQDPASLLWDANGNRRGGTFAKAFTADTDPTKGTLTGTFQNWTDPYGFQSGLLYEAAIYWHYGRLADDIQTSSVDLGTGNPSSTPCFGGNDYYSRLQIESKGINPGKLNLVTKNISSSMLSTYFNLLKELQNCDAQGNCAQVLAELAQMLADNPKLALYDSLLPYINPDDLPPEANSSGDSTPNRDVETLDITEGVKPQYIKSQRRSWIDLRP